MATKRKRLEKKNLSRARKESRKSAVRSSGKLRTIFAKDYYGGLHITSTYVNNDEAVQEAQKQLDFITRRLRITRTYTYDKVSEHDLMLILNGTLSKAVENGLVYFIQQGFINSKDRGESVRKFLHVAILSQCRTISELVVRINQVASWLKRYHTKGRQSAYQIVWYNRFADYGTLY